MENLSNPDHLNFDKIWLMFQETDRKFKETDKNYPSWKAYLHHNGVN